MVLSNTKRTSSIQSIINQNYGGGEKKAGLPYTVGRTHWSSIFMRDRIYSGTALRTTLVFTRNTVRPTGVDGRIPMR